MKTSVMKIQRGTSTGIYIYSLYHMIIYNIELEINYQSTPKPNEKKRIISTEKSQLTHEKELKSLKESINELLIKNKSLSNENELRSELIETLKYKWQLSRIEIESIKKKLEKTIKYKDLYRQEKSLREKYEQENKQIIEKKESNNVLIKEKTELLSRIEFLEDQLSYYDKDMLRYEKKIESLKNDLNNCIKEKNQIDEQYRELNVLKDEYEHQKIELEKKISLLTDDYNALKLEISSNYIEINKLKRLLQDKEVELESTKLDLLSKDSEIEKMRNELVELINRENKLKLENELKDKEIASLTEKLNMKEKIILENKKLDDIINPNKHFVSLHEEVVSLKRQILDQEKLIKQLEKEKESWKKVAEEMKEEVTNVQAYIIQNTSISDNKNINRIPTPTNKVLVRRTKPGNISNKPSTDCNTKLSDLCYKLISENKLLKEKLAASQTNSSEHQSTPTNINVKRIATKKITRLCSPSRPLKEKN